MANSCIKLKLLSLIPIALDAYMEHIMILQPLSLHLRMLIPLLMIQIGKDDEAYGFIKFWVKITPIQGNLDMDIMFYLESLLHSFIFKQTCLVPIVAKNHITSFEILVNSYKEPKALAL